MWTLEQAFRQELRKPTHQVASKAMLLDSAYREVPDGNFFTPGADDFQDFIVDGSVDIDKSRGTRRTATLTLLNKDGAFTPDGKVDDYDGKFYVNRFIRLFRGVVLAGGTAIYVPIGTFMIDTIDTIVERNMSLLNMTLSDPWKKLQKSLVTRTRTFAIDTPINTVIRTLAAEAGADYPLAPNLDQLSGRPAGTTDLNGKLTIERGESRGDVIKTIANKFGIDIYFNQEGRLSSQDRKAPRDASEVWHFYSSIDMTGMLNSVTRTLSDDNLFNHVFVIGTGIPTAPVIFERRNTSLASPTSIARIGDRVTILEGQTWKTQAQVNAAGEKLWDTVSNLFEDLTIDTICNPALEADDVIRITEPLSRLSGAYRINQMNVPLTTSKQTIKVTRNVYV